MPDAPVPTTRRSWWRPRLSVRMLMLVIALASLWFAWVAMSSRGVAVVDVGPPDLIAVGDIPHTLPSLQNYIRASRVREVVIRLPSNMPLNSLLRITGAIEAAGLHRIRFSQQLGPLNPALKRTAARDSSS
jgi:hypothetical protein